MSRKPAVHTEADKEEGNEFGGSDLSKMVFEILRVAQVYLKLELRPCQSVVYFHSYLQDAIENSNFCCYN